MNGKALINSMYSLCEMIDAELARHIIPSLSSMPAILGATLGVERGSLVRMMMNEREEFVGRALNVACRLQSAVKEKESLPGDEGSLVRLATRRSCLPACTTNDSDTLNMPYRVESTTSPLRNILRGANSPVERLISPPIAQDKRCRGPRGETLGWTRALELGELALTAAGLLAGLPSLIPSGW